jgi:hypothetical protein
MVHYRLLFTHESAGATLAPGPPTIPPGRITHHSEAEPSRTHGPELGFWEAAHSGLWADDASIRKFGGPWSTAKLREMGITFYRGGHQLSLDADTRLGMDQYVHLCFTSELPMAYARSGNSTLVL